MAPRIELHGASRHWDGAVAVDGVDLVVEPGERVAVIGPSGGGKSTLLRLIAGALAASRGRVVVGGLDLSAATESELRGHRRRCGIVPQGASLVPQLTVHHNLLLGLVPRWPTWRVALAGLVPYLLERQTTAQWLERVDLAGKQNQRAETLSGGEAQRVAVARALLAGPELILADEPSASLDPTVAERVLDLLLPPVASDPPPRTIMVSTHAVRRVKDRVHRVVGLRDGEVALDVGVSDLTETALEALYAGSEDLH